MVFMKKNFESKVLTVSLVILCFTMLFFVYKQRQFRRQFNEVQQLPYKGTSLEALEDGIYTGKTFTSFLSLEVEAVIENHAYKEIKIVNVTGGKESHIQTFIDDLLQNKKITVPSKKRYLLETLVFLSCMDQLEKIEQSE